MKFFETELPDVYIVESGVFYDGRGSFFESYRRDIFKEAGLNYDFIQDNQSKSVYGTVRGLHFQRGNAAQAKLVRVALGCILDVVLDLRPNSPGFGRHIAVELSDVNFRQLMIPRGCAHGFSVLSPEAVFVYKCDNVYNKAAEDGVLFCDPDLNIDWKIPEKDWILSEKDKHWLRFSEMNFQECPENL